MLNNNRKIVLFKETAHSLPYGPGGIRMPAMVKCQSGVIAAPVALEAG